MPLFCGVKLHGGSEVGVGLAFCGVTIERLPWNRRWLYESTQPSFTYSTSAIVLSGPSWKTVVRTHSVLQAPSGCSAEAWATRFPSA